MFHYEYVTRKAAKPYREEFLGIIHKVQDLSRDFFTFQYHFIGSSARNMITCDFHTNKGFDFDVNLYINDDDEEYSAEEIKHILMNAINQVAQPRGYEYCEDSTRVISLKKKAKDGNRIEYSCDFAIVYDYRENSGKKHQQYIRFQKSQNSYYWDEQPEGYNLDEKVKWIKQNNLWDDVLDIYLNKKNNNTDQNKKSRALYAETINEVASKYGYSQSAHNSSR